MCKRESIIYANVNKLLLACIRMLHISVVLSNVFKSPIWWCIIYIGEEKVFFSTEGNSLYHTEWFILWLLGEVGNTVSMKSIQSTYLKQISHQPTNSNNGNNNCNYNWDY